MLIDLLSHLVYPVIPITTYLLSPPDIKHRTLNYVLTCP